MVDGYGKQLIRLLREHGYIQRSGGKGDHEKWTNPKTGKTVIVDRGVRSKFTANGVLKDAGIKHKF
ncbi:MAG: type II toxin-antitoxin system HicA family toxin [Sphingomonadaceae bacterium]